MVALQSVSLQIDPSTRKAIARLTEDCHESLMESPDG